MSEATLAAVATPILQEAEKALEPAAAKILADTRKFITAEADRMRTELPTLAQAAADHIHAIGSGLLAHYEAVAAHIDATLAGHTPAPVDPTAASPETPTTPAA